MYVKKETQRIYKKGDDGFALVLVEHEQWDLTDTPNEALDDAEFEKEKPAKK